MTNKRYAVIVNPSGGNRRVLAVWKQIEPTFADVGAEVVVYQTQYAGHGSVLAQSLDLESHEAICVVGGDGTIHEV